VAGRRAVSPALAASRCDLCGAADAAPVLAAPHDPAPLVRCRGCGLLYVAGPPEAAGGAPGGPAPDGLVDPAVEAAEAPWRRAAAEARLARVRRFVPGGRLLEVGCAGGDLLLAARAAGFEVAGVDPDPGTSAHCRDALGLSVETATATGAALPAGVFDVACAFHVLEHVPSPRATVAALRRALRPGGVLALELPVADGPWLRLLGARWRQLIPGHLTFFTSATLTRLLEGEGLAVLARAPAVRPASVRLVADRLGRLARPLGAAAGRLAAATGVADATVRLPLPDVAFVVAARR